MKKLKYLLLLCVFAIITTGCVKFSTNMDIKKDKSMDFSIIYAFDKSFLSMAGGDAGIKEEEFEDLKKQGYTVEKYSENNYDGVKITKKISNIDEVSTTDDVVFELSKMDENSEEDNKYIFKVVKGEEKNTYYAKIKFNAGDSAMNTGLDNEPTDETEIIDDNSELIDENSELVDESNTPDEEDSFDLTSSSENGMDLSSLTENLDLTFNVSLPYSAISSNATKKENDDKNLSWKLGTSGEELIEFSFELKNNEGSSNMLLYIGIGAIVLIIIIVLVLVLTKKKKNNGVVDNMPINSNPVPEMNNVVNDNVVPETSSNVVPGTGNVGISTTSETNINNQQ